MYKSKGVRQIEKGGEMEKWTQTIEREREREEEGER